MGLAILPRISFFILFVGTSACIHTEATLDEAPSFRLAFGSCNDQKRNQSFWPNIAKYQPKLWIWLGDVIYADDFSLADRAKAYQSVRNLKSYQSMIEDIPVLGTWDDHDYAHNNAGAEYPLKAGSQQLFLDFLSIPQNDPLRKQQGLYRSHVIRDEGRSLKFVILDLRYFKGENQTETDLLGEQQWTWLEGELKDPNPDLIVLVSSIQVLTSFDRKETWAAFPKANQRLLPLLNEVVKPLLVLSGDRHFAEFSRRTLPSGKNIYEFTSSGLTHHTTRANENQWSLKGPYYERNFGLIDVTWDSTGRPNVWMRAVNAETGKLVAELRELP
jgi:alkaline phosphatase D